MNIVTRIKRISVAALFAALAYFCVLLALPYFVPQDEIREAVTGSLRAATGETPEVGKAHFSVLPRPAVRFENIRFAGSDRNTLSAGSLRATVRLMPLLFGRVELASLAFEEPHLNIEVGPNGVRLLGLPASPPARQAISLPEIKIVDGRVDLRSPDSSKVESLWGVNATLTWPGKGVSTTASFRWRGLQSNASLRITDAGALGENARSPVRFRFETDNARAGFEGKFAFRKGLQAEGMLSFDTKSLRSLLASFGVDAPTRGGFETLSLKSRAQIIPSGLTASELSIDLDGNRADGTMSLAIDASRPVLQGTLAASTADLSAYAGGFSLVTADGRDWNRETLDIKPLTGFDLDLRLSAGKIIFGKNQAEKVALAATVKSGRFTLSAGEAQLFGGTLRGTAEIGPAPGGAKIRVDANIKDFNSAQGVGAVTGNRAMEGTGTFTLALAGSGANVSEITHDLKGNAELSVASGALTGINIEGALRALSRKPLSVLGEFRSGRTPFDHFIVKLAVTDGNAAFEQARIDSGSVAVSLKGLASIPARGLDLRGVAQLIPATGAPTNLALPFYVRGNWSDPVLMPNTSALLRHSEFRSILSGWRQAVQP